MTSDRREAYELELSKQRTETFARLRPGQLVAIVGRILEVDMSAYAAPAPRWEKIKVDNLHTWKRPTSARITNETTGPIWIKGTLVTIVGMVPLVRCKIYGKRPWIMAVASDGTVGWTYELDALEIVSSE